MEVPVEIPVHTSWAMSPPRPWMVHEDAATPFHRARFESIAAALPETRLSTEALMQTTKHASGIDLEKLTGIRERRVCSEGEDSFTLARDAAHASLARSRHPASDLEMLLSCGITRYHGGIRYRFEPPMSHALRDVLGAKNARVLDISNACAGMLTGVFILNDFIRRGVIRCGMVVSGEYISPLHRSATEQVHSVLSKQLASLTLGDAGAAAILERAPEDGPGISVACFTTLAEHSRLCLAVPSEHGPGAMMRTEARALHRVALRDAPPLLREALESAGLDLGDIDYLIPHQTSTRAIRMGEQMLLEKFGVKPKHLVVTVDELGNTASTTHFVAMDRYLREGRFAPGDKILLLAFASGLEVGVVIFEMDHLAELHGNPD